MLTLQSMSYLFTIEINGSSHAIHRHVFDLKGARGHNARERERWWIESTKADDLFHSYSESTKKINEYSKSISLRDRRRCLASSWFKTGQIFTITRSLTHEPVWSRSWTIRLFIRRYWLTMMMKRVFNQSFHCILQQHFSCIVGCSYSIYSVEERSQYVSVLRVNVYVSDAFSRVIRPTNTNVVALVEHDVIANRYRRDLRQLWAVRHFSYW